MTINTKFTNEINRNEYMLQLYFFLRILVVFKKQEIKKKGHKLRNQLHYLSYMESIIVIVVCFFFQV